MSYLDIFCNYIQCRKRLVNKAVITSCSHAFCMQHGNQILSTELICPVCETPLNKNKYDLTCVDLNPPEEFRSMILAGLRPEIIIDIAHRAIGLWTYQIHMEYMYRIQQHEEWKKKHLQAQQIYETELNNSKIKMNHLLQKISNLEKQLQHQTIVSQELREKLDAKMREHSTTLQKYSLLKHRHLSDSAKYSRMKDHSPKSNTINNIDFNSLRRNPEIRSASQGLPIRSVQRRIITHFTRSEPHFLFQDGDKLTQRADDNTTVTNSK